MISTIELKEFVQVLPKKPGINVNLRNSGRNLIQKKEANFDEEKNEWYTPKILIDSLKIAGKELDSNCKSNEFLFDLDPASSKEAESIVKIAKKIYTKEDDGLISEWKKDDYVFMNPPFSKNLFQPFIEKFIEHNNGILLIFDRMTAISKKLIIPNSTVCLHLAKRVKFININGEEKFNPFYGTALYAFGEKATRHLLVARKTLIQYNPICTFSEEGIKILLESIVTKEKEH